MPIQNIKNTYKVQIVIIKTNKEHKLYLWSKTGSPRQSGITFPARV